MVYGLFFIVLAPCFALTFRRHLKNPMEIRTLMGWISMGFYFIAQSFHRLFHAAFWLF